MLFLEKYGPWAVVTGASEGIGLELARGLAQRGQNVVLVARREERLRELAAEFKAGWGVKTRVIAADLSLAGDLEQVLAETETLDVGLLAAAAGYGTSGPFVESGVERELNMADVNCRSVAAMSHAFGRRFVERGRGGLILLSSLVAFQGVPRAAHYAATKAYVQTLAEGLYWELRPLGVDVLACAPGPVASGFAERANMRMGLALTPADVAQATLNALGRGMTVRPGWLSKALESALALLPRRGRVRMMQVVMGGMTEHQNGEAKTQARGSA